MSFFGIPNVGVNIGCYGGGSFLGTNVKGDVSKGAGESEEGFLFALAEVGTRMSVEGACVDFERGRDADGVVAVATRLGGMQR